jgi:hypothetical protein
MVDLVTNQGEEYLIENNANGETIKVGLYEDATDTLGETSTLSDITTEPAGGSYSRQSDTVTTLQISGNFGFDNDNLITFDTSDSSQTVDAVFVVINFQSDTVAGDASANDNLIGARDLNSTRDLSSVSEVEIAAGDLELTVD